MPIILQRNRFRREEESARKRREEICLWKYKPADVWLRRCVFVGLEKYVIDGTARLIHRQNHRLLTDDALHQLLSD